MMIAAADFLTNEFRKRAKIFVLTLFTYAALC
jgi:hypothetical protein